MAPGSDASAAGMETHLEQLLDYLELDRVHVVGNSLGGWIALEFALAGRALSVTALAPAGFWSSELVPVVAHANRWAARLVSPIAPMLLRLTALRTVGFWSSSADPAALDPELAARATHAQATASGWAAALAATHHRHCNAQSIDAAVPVTVVWGDRDRILPAGSCQESAGLPPHARWVRLSRCGHVPMWDQPVATLQLIDETIATAAQRQRTSSVTPHS
jgi:pimeloyl-ACP methyl ester carboxylesterase